MMIQLAQGECKQGKENTVALSEAEVEKYLDEQLPEWDCDGGAIRRRFRFGDFHQTMAFVNQLAEIANAENHHPDLQVSYAHCEVTFTTHSLGGKLSLNDLICAAKVDGL